MALEITGDRVLFEDPFLVMKERSFRDRHGNGHKWSYVERRADRGAVVVVPITRESRSLIVIRQFRVPFDRIVVEFPAGLMDEGETPEQTAIRELLEETGYAGRVLSTGPAVASSPGLTTERVHIAFVETDEHPKQDATPEGSEEIEVLRIPEAEIGAALKRWESAGDVIDTKLYVYLRTRVGM